MSAKEYQRIEVITGVALAPALVDGSKAADHRGEFRTGRDGVFGRPAQWRGAQSSLPMAPAVERGRYGSRGFGRTRGRQFGTPASSGAGARTGTPAWPQDHGVRDPPGSVRQFSGKQTALRGRSRLRREVCGEADRRGARCSNVPTSLIGTTEEPRCGALTARPMTKTCCRSSAASSTSGRHMALPPHHGAGEPGTSPDWDDPLSTANGCTGLCSRPRCSWSAILADASGAFMTAR